MFSPIEIVFADGRCVRGIVYVPMVEDEATAERAGQIIQDAVLRIMDEL